MSLLLLTTTTFWLFRAPNKATTQYTIPCMEWKQDTELTDGIVDLNSISKSNHM